VPWAQTDIVAALPPELHINALVRQENNKKKRAMIEQTFGVALPQGSFGSCAGDPVGNRKPATSNVAVGIRCTGRFRF